MIFTGKGNLPGLIVLSSVRSTSVMKISSTLMSNDSGQTGTRSVALFS
jgi:hypothetical protein